MFKKIILMIALIGSMTSSAYALGGFEAMYSKTRNGLKVVITTENNSIYGYIFTEFDGRVTVIQKRKKMIDDYLNNVLTLRTKATVGDTALPQWDIFDNILRVESNRIKKKIVDSGVGVAEFHRLSFEKISASEAKKIIDSNIEAAKPFCGDYL